MEDAPHTPVFLPREDERGSRMSPAVSELINPRSSPSVVLIVCAVLLGILEGRGGEGRKRGRGGKGNRGEKRGGKGWDGRGGEEEGEEERGKGGEGKGGEGKGGEGGEERGRKGIRGEKRGGEGWKGEEERGGEEGRRVAVCTVCTHTYVAQVWVG